MPDPFTMLIPAAARTAHAQLVAALGTENNPAQWMTFMETVTRLLPDVLSSGRPSKEAIQRCPIGQLGFSSWQEMIEAPSDVSGLGWKFSSWKAWRRSWSIVQANPWLRAEQFNSSELNIFALELKRDGLPFPQSAEELETIRQARKDAQEQRRAETVQALTLRAETAEKTAQEATAGISTLTEQLTQANARLIELSEQIGVLKAQAAPVAAERDRWKKEAERLAKQPLPKLSRWEHLQAFFRGQ